MEHNLGFNPEDTLQTINALGYFNRPDKHLLEVTLTENDKAKCIEVNCAFGYTTSHIILPKLHPNSRIIATDHSEKMIDYARKIYGNERIDFEVLDIQTQNLPERYISEFDHVFSFPTINSRNDIRQELQNIYKMLKSEGLLHMSLIINHDAFHVLNMMQSSDSHLKMLTKEYVPLFYDMHTDLKKTKEWLDTLLSGLGFSTNEVYFSEIESKEHCCDSSLHYILYDLPFYSIMPPQSVDDFKDQFTTRFIFIKPFINKSNFLNNIDKYDVINVLAKKKS